MSRPLKFLWLFFFLIGTPLIFENCSSGLSTGSASSNPSIASANGNGTSASNSTSSSESSNGSGVGISANYPNDVGIQSDARVLFYSGFENGLAGWNTSNYAATPTYINVVNNPQLAHGGSNYLQTTVTKTQLAISPYISAYIQYYLPVQIPVVYWRVYVRYVSNVRPPHHWLRVTGGNASYASDGWANCLTTDPNCLDNGFWYNLDASSALNLNYYVYWDKMRSGRCNNGTATPGCVGDQGTTYYYGNNYTPANQSGFARDQWFCLEMMTKVNTVGQYDGALALWKDNALVGQYQTGRPSGTFLRDNFFSFGAYDTSPNPFPGFDFRNQNNIFMKSVTLGSYYEQRDFTSADPESNTILYDDVVVATDRIGCKVP